MPGSSGVWGAPSPTTFLYILIFQVLGVSHLLYSTADFFVNVLRPSTMAQDRLDGLSLLAIIETWCCSEVGHWQHYRQVCKH